MVIYSNEIKNFLDKIYFYELSRRNDLDFPLYYFYEEKLYSIDKLSSHKPSTTFPMSRDGLFGMIIGRLEFGYSYDGTNVYVQYYINCKPQNDWFDWLIKETKIKSINNNTMNNTKNRIRLTETQLHNLIKESVKRVLREDSFDVPPMSKWAPHTQKMVTMFENLRQSIEAIGKYAGEQGIFDFTTPQNGHIAARQYNDIKKDIEMLYNIADHLQNNWGRLLYKKDKNYKSRPEFQLPR